MSTTTQLSSLLRSLDAAETPTQLDPEIDARAQALMAKTLATPPPSPALISSRPRVSGRWALAATAAAAAAAVVLAPAYWAGTKSAAWAAVPVADKDAAATAQRACASDARSLEVPRDLGPVDLRRMVPVLSDVRGSLVLVYLTDGQSELTCYFEHGNAGFAGSIANTDNPQETAVPVDSVRGSGGSITATDLGLVRAVTGRVGADVVSVVLDTVAKGKVTATVVNGHFAAWWPDDTITDATEDKASPGDELTGVSVTLRSGRVRSVPVAEVLRS